MKVHKSRQLTIYERTKAHGVLLEGKNKNKSSDGIYITIECSGSLINPSFPQPGLKHPSSGNTTARDSIGHGYDDVTISSHCSLSGKKLIWQMGWKIFLHCRRTTFIDCDRISFSVECSGVVLRFSIRLMVAYVMSFPFGRLAR